MYSISKVSAITGVNAITLRAWERRYGLIRPKRTAKGHRMYSNADVESIKRIVLLVEEGIAIGQVANVVNTEPSKKVNPTANPWQDYHDRMLKAVTYFDEQVLEAIYNEALSVHPVDSVAKFFKR